jgi:hypothetical protein
VLVLRREERLDESEVVAGRYLQQPGVALYGSDPPSDALNERRAVGRRREVLRERATQRRSEKRLRGLCGDEAIAIDRLYDHLFVDTLEGIPDGQDGNRPVETLPERCDEALDDRVGDERACRVMDDDDERADGDLEERCRNGRRTRWPSGDAGNDLGDGELFC